MRLGDLTVTPVVDGGMDVPAEAILNKAPHPSHLTEEGLLRVQMGGYLIRTGDRVMLVDTGFGPDVLGPGSGVLLESLAAAGLQPSDVTDVLLTHLHMDHIGWTTIEDKPVFPTAVYRCHADDWAHFVTDENDEFMREMLGVPKACEKLAPIAGQLESFDSDTTLAPGVDVRHAPGHTPGSTVVVLSSGTDRAMLLGDVLHCPAELMGDDWEMMADVDPVLASRTRVALARELEGSDIPVAAAHFPGLRFGRLLSATSWEYADA
jgi:glyoxylase-like metal-dependent hydrolase (beta-lactamase superfamily II)